AQHSGAEAGAHPERCCYGLAGVGIGRVDVDGSGIRRGGDVRSASLCVGKVQATEVKSLEGSGSHARSIGWLHARLARKDVVSQGQRLRVSEREARRQEAAVSIRHGTEIPEARRGQSWCARDGLEGSPWFSQFSALTGNCAGEAESGSEDSAG